MDYTDNLERNKQPTELNYDMLMSLYGPLGGQRQRRERLQLRMLERNEQNFIPEAYTNSSGHHQDLSVQRLRKKVSFRNNIRIHDVSAEGSDDVNAHVFRTVPDDIKKEKDKAVQVLFDRVRNEDPDDYEIAAGYTHKDGWKLLHRKLYGEEHEMELGMGYKVRIQLLLDHKQTIR
ncbi:unnamed protein product [Pseudo-nitzschia multistriata]|uniref:Uncharacterized protein n=1 Tax=Pseudo-nitzschia multistriata TaxID=183589 RepID=A0A448ZHQ9_9STRA|nr:unnamed protein product [Pseudo-nitzschia multistriata]